MSCPYCGKPEEYFTGNTTLIEISWPHVSVDFECTCDNCDKTFWQRYYFITDDYEYENISDEKHERDVKEMEE